MTNFEENLLIFKKHKILTFYDFTLDFGEAHVHLKATELTNNDEIKFTQTKIEIFSEDIQLIQKTVERIKSYIHHILSGTEIIQEFESRGMKISLAATISGSPLCPVQNPISEPHYIDFRTKK